MLILFTVDLKRKKSNNRHQLKNSLFGIFVVKYKQCHLENFSLLSMTYQQKHQLFESDNSFRLKNSDFLKWENVTKERENLTIKAMETSTPQKVPERKAVDFSEQEVPRSCRELMTLNHRKLYKKNKKFPKQRFIQNKNEDDVEFLRRVNQVTHTLLEEEMFKIKFGIDDAKHTCKRSIQQNSGHAKRKINQHGAESSLLNRRRRRRSRRKDTTLQCDD
ncbi:hypothetical protein T4E_4892 [Trichinella pseudospiralis]|uniref:Uncharacterized protein n=1 Tax=Trichinella pseudospiralis TaxID=6337 RepID=A0A0V0Y7Q5_TRIPS|nr:hypothetical protein T4E_4892 [Trichinella pseudospiralis]